MKIILLHGPGEVGKRAEALRIRKQFSPDAVAIVDLKQDGVDKLEMALTAVSLFESGPRLVVAENAPDKLDLSLLPAVGENLTLLIIAGAPKFTTSLLQSVAKVRAKAYSFEGEKETSIFPYLDGLIEQKKEAFAELQKLLADFAGAYILTMVYYGLRRNILPLPASPFARKKIEAQKHRFGFSDWERFYKLTLQTEFAIKSGKVTEELGLVRLTQAFVARA